MSNQSTFIINGGHDQGISPLDRGFSYGDGVFRTLKVANGQPVSWHLHYQKLVADCVAIGIVCPSAELLINDMYMLLDADEFAVIKIIITRGLGERGYAPPAITAPTRVVIKSTMPNYAETYFTEGIALYQCKTRLSKPTQLAGIKHLNRLENVLARAEWSDPALAEGLLLDADGNVIECTAANIFVRVGDSLMTPALDACGVAGVTRQRILDLAYTLSLKTSIQTLTLDAFLSAEEVIICNSLMGAWQVRALGAKQWNKGELASQIRSQLA